jgi:hypothetical protein
VIAEEHKQCTSLQTKQHSNSVNARNLRVCNCKGDSSSEHELELLKQAPQSYCSTACATLPVPSFWFTSHGKWMLSCYHSNKLSCAAAQTLKVTSNQGLDRACHLVCLQFTCLVALS